MLLGLMLSMFNVSACAPLTGIRGLTYVPSVYNNFCG
jgi:hypothetical protein